ncbi:MAG: GDSL-type esterase/lipase family protein [Cryobacterium sp.]
MSASIALVGDGLLAGGQWEKWLPEYDVVNLAVPGGTTDDVIGTLDQVVDLHPDAVVLQIGTNDLGWRKSDEHVVRNIETILHTLRKQLPRTRILVHLVLPRGHDFSATIQSINRHIWQYAPTQYVQYLDLWAAMAQPDGELAVGLSDDRLHLTPAGYEAWLAELRPALDALFERPPSTSAIPTQHV